MTNMNDIAKDMGANVNVGGDKVVKMAGNTNEAKNLTKQANVHLTNADGHQRKATNKLCVVLSLVLLIIAVVVIVLLAMGKL
jgi:t-SNARE complex subunit (syntaxin)